MQKLHLIGFTPELDGLILSARKGAKSGSFVVKVDAAVLKQLAETATSAPPSARTNGARPGSHAPRSVRPESQLTPREMQELLRAGWTLEEVAAEAGVDVDWVSRFASPVLAEMRLVLEQARGLVFTRPRFGTSALGLDASVRRNVAERGIRFTDEEFDASWRAHQLDDLTWVVGFDYQSRGRKQSAEWTLDLEEGELASHNRLGGQLGYVQSARRRVNTAPPPKSKPKGATKRATRTSAEPAATTARPRASRSAPARVKKKAAPGKKPAKPRVHTLATAPPAPLPRPSTTTTTTTRSATEPAAPRPHDPYREELRRRHAAQAAPKPEPALDAEPAPRAPEPESEPELRPVAIIGPTVRALARRPPRASMPMPTATEPEPAPPRRHGPLPAPEPIAVPATIRERVAMPLGTVEPAEDDVIEDDVEDHDIEDHDIEDSEDIEVIEDSEDSEVVDATPPPRPAPRPAPPPPAPARHAPPTFKGAQSASAAPDARAAPAVRRRPRRTEPLRGR